MYARLPGQAYLEAMAERNKRVLDNEVAIGCAVLYRTDRLEPVDPAAVEDDPNTVVGAMYSTRGMSWSGMVWRGAVRCGAMRCGAA